MPHKELLLSINDSLWECNKFIANHPGEGIQDVYLKNYHKKNVTEEFERYHFDNEPDDWLDRAKSSHYDPETGIYYIGPNPFKNKRRIPPYFHFFPSADAPSNTQSGTEYLTEKNQPKSFILFPIFKEENSFILMKRDESENIQNISVKKSGSTEDNNTNAWAVSGSDIDTSNSQSFDELIELLTKDYQPV